VKYKKREELAKIKKMNDELEEERKRRIEAEIQLRL
jgi:hypothetical protein